ncbi:retrovirus-related Pol polyprotein from transposon 297 [Magallana gigas]|uniref:retrovirus-related Pol polyprotein from transposon 297 n=1 Tax=Magallana gigas TaxID=29159 RepID=UPI0033424552
MEQLKPPSHLSFEGNLAENWKEWLQGFRLYLIASGIDEKAGKVQVATFLHVAGVEARRIYNTFNIPEEDVDKLDVLIQCFQDYVEPRKNLTYVRHIFFTRKQETHETIDNYVTDLKNKALQCEFGDLKESLIRDRIVCGISNEACRARLLREADLTLVKCIDICRASELSEHQLKTLHQEPVAAVSAHAVSKKHNHEKQHNSSETHRKQKANVQSTHTGKPCGRCGRQHQKGKCFAYNKLCYKCKSPNHYAKYCKTGSKSSVHSLEETEEDLYLGTVSVDSIHEELPWTESVTINNVPVTFKLDTGAQANIIPRNVFNSLQISRKHLQSVNVNLITYNGDVMKPDGKVDIRCRIRKVEHTLPFYVTNKGSTPILSKETCARLGLIQHIPAESIDKDVCMSKDKLIEQYADIFSGLGKLPGKYHIEIHKSANPVVHPPRKIPAALLKPVQDELKRMEDLGVITKQDGPTDWVNSMVTVRKPGKIRICVDPKDLNQHIKREHYHLVTVEEIIERLPNAKVFSRFDATHGFWHIQLDEESSKALTFNTPFGRYRYLRLPFGISSASEVFSKRVQELFSDLPGVECLVDDILVHGESNAEHDENLIRMLERCRKVGLKLNRDKVELRVPEVKYVGHIIGKDGLKVDPEKVRAIVNMPEPTDIQGVRRFLGLVQYASKFIPNLADVSEPLRILTKNDVVWHWEKEQVDSFARLKEILTQAPVLKIYDLEKDVTISVDASCKGLGAVLLQNGQPVAYASRALTETQQRYAQIEREMLAVIYGCEKFHHYIYGRSITIETDHKPLLAIHRKPLYQATPRLQRMLMRLQRYDVQLKYVPGKEMFISDALSRAFLKECKETLVDEDIDVNFIEQELPMTEKKLQELKDATEADEQFQTLADIVRVGWPETRDQVPTCVRMFWNYRGEITVLNGLLYKGQSVMIPSSLQRQMLTKLHEPHLGIVKTKQRARNIIFWPNMNFDIEQLIQSCGVCNSFRKSNIKQPLIPHEIPNTPWTKVGADIFHFKGKDYLLLVDYYSKYPDIIPLPDLRARSTIAACKTVFARNGIPLELFSDNGPQFSCHEFKCFASDWEFAHRTSSPRYPRSNGQAERCIQTIKNLLKKAEESNSDPNIALLEYRNTPIDGIGKSPAQLLMNRSLRSKIPTTRTWLEPKPLESQLSKLQLRQMKQKYFHDRTCSKLPHIEEREIIRMQNPENRNWEPGVIQQNLGNRSYSILNQHGRALRRNRSQILKSRETNFQMLPPEVEPQLSESVPSESENSDDVSNVNTPHSSQENPVANSKPSVTRSGRISRPPAYLSEYVK